MNFPAQKTIFHSFSLFLVLFLLLSQNSDAQQKTPVLRVVIAETVNIAADGVNITFNNKERLDITTDVTEALYREFTIPVRAKNPPKFFVLGTPDIAAAARRLGISTRSAEDYFRIAEELKADLLVKSDALSYLSAYRRKCSPNALAGVQIYDVRLRIPVGSGIAGYNTKMMSQAVERAVKEAMRQSWVRFGITANIVSVIGENVVLDKGTQDGMWVGEDFLVFREIDGQRVKIGKIRTARAYPTDAEADILEGKDFRRDDKLIRTVRLSYFVPCCAPIGANVKQ